MTQASSPRRPLGRRSTIVALVAALVAAAVAWNVVTATATGRCVDHSRMLGTLAPKFAFLPPTMRCQVLDAGGLRMITEPWTTHPLAGALAPAVAFVTVLVLVRMLLMRSWRPVAR